MTDSETPDPIAVETPAPPRRRRVLRLSMFPTMLTLGNLVCGVLAIAYVSDATGLFSAGRASEGAARIALAGWMILLGQVFDGLDGRVARLTRTTTNFGGQLDSLSDVVTFGVAPALLAKAMVEHSFASQNPKMAFLTAAFYAVCAALRLARYNAEHDEPDQAVNHFVGLPTPGAAGVVAGIAIVHEWLLAHWAPGPEGLAVAAHLMRFVVLVGLGLLMVSRVPYLHFTNRFLSGRRPIGRVALLVLLVVLALELDNPALIVGGVFFAYALSGPISVIPRLVRGRRQEVVPELFE